MEPIQNYQILSNLFLITFKLLLLETTATSSWEPSKHFEKAINEAIDFEMTESWKNLFEHHYLRMGLWCETIMGILPRSKHCSNLAVVKAKQIGTVAIA